jgi:hypothetical protein
MRELININWFDDEYIKVYNILNIENRMPSLSKIYVLDDCDVESMQILPRDTVMAFALPSRDTEKQYIWFRYEPPELMIFAHEMIHLSKKHKRLNDEIYAYNLAPLVTILAERNIIPKHNVLRLFEDINLNDLNKKIIQYFHVSGIEELFLSLGVVPHFIVLNDGRISIRKGYMEDDIVIETIAELIAAAEYDDFILNFILQLLNDLVLEGRGVPFQ